MLFYVILFHFIAIKTNNADDFIHALQLWR